MEVELLPLLGSVATFQSGNNHPEIRNFLLLESRDPSSEAPPTSSSTSDGLMIGVADSSTDAMDP